MVTTIDFTNDELAQLHLLVSQDTESSRVELHHTSGREYREYIQKRLDRGTALLNKMDAALPALCKKVTDTKEF
ncbi:MAG: hypothetical protein WCI73_06475 [Phycisphaerae bacterium]